MYFEQQAWAAVKEGKARLKPRQIFRGPRVARIASRLVMIARPAERLPMELRSEASARIWTMRKLTSREGRGAAAFWITRGACPAISVACGSVDVRFSPNACRRG